MIAIWDFFERIKAVVSQKAEFEIREKSILFATCLFQSLGFPLQGKKNNTLFYGSLQNLWTDNLKEEIGRFFYICIIVCWNAKSSDIKVTVKFSCYTLKSVTTVGHLYCLIFLPSAQIAAKNMENLLSSNFLSTFWQF